MPTFKKKISNQLTCILILYTFNVQGQEEQTKCKFSKRKEIIKIRGEISEIENRKIIEQKNPKVGSFKRLRKLTSFKKEKQKSMQITEIIIEMEKFLPEIINEMGKC